MSMTFNKKGDDDYFIRLLSYFRSHFREDIIEMVPFRKSVILLKTTKNAYMLKGYQTLNRLKLQEAFTRTLKKEGFSSTYQFVKLPFNETLHFDGYYYGGIEYIHPHKIPFTFQTQKNRQEGIELLEQFHEVTRSFESRYRTLIPKNKIIEKWKERTNIFVNNLPALRYFIHEQYLTEMLSWANWSLNGMEENQSFFLKEPFVVLHSDVAHHNFLRDKRWKLHLIDFDLISIGPEVLDYLQYANRILPHLDWSVDRLKTHNKFDSLLKQEAFLYALIFPADIFREWNRLIREKSYTDPQKYNQVMELTIGQFLSRKRFIDGIKKTL
ncbi:MAG: aminoglycoside phosphotransferase [Neobacillus sp.]|nr:aminoglycoside phosphotransferase [Neobacillus sp.]